MFNSLILYLKSQSDQPIMKLKLFYYLVLIFTSMEASAQNVLVPQLKKNIKIDGDLSDWETPFLGPFAIHNSGQKPTQLTYAALSWNKISLFIAFKCMDTKIIGKERINDAYIFSTDDLVEVFIDPDGDGRQYLELGVNAYSSQYDLIVHCISKDCGGWKTDISMNLKNSKTISKIVKDGYTVEIEIPFESLKSIVSANFRTPKIGTKWKANLFRIDFGMKTEYQSLKSYDSKTYGFHQPKEFATLEFVE